MGLPSICSFLRCLQRFSCTFRKAGHEALTGSPSFMSKLLGSSDSTSPVEVHVH